MGRPIRRLSVSLNLHRYTEALRGAARLAQQHARAREREEAKRGSGSDGVRGFARPGLPQFENRGGAVHVESI
jgi:hypothetical protein